MRATSPEDLKRWIRAWETDPDDAPEAAEGVFEVLMTTPPVTAIRLGGLLQVVLKSTH